MVRIWFGYIHIPLYKCTTDQGFQKGDSHQQYRYFTGIIDAGTISKPKSTKHCAGGGIPYRQNVEDPFGSLDQLSLGMPQPCFRASKNVTRGHAERMARSQIISMNRF